MTFVPAMLIVWGFTVLIMIATLLYRSRIGRDEEDQLFLDDSFSQAKAEQAAIAARVQRVQPLVKGSEIVAGLATLFVVGYFALDIFNQFR
ncbi:MAG TPA: hypothetical protein VGF82_00545 [Terracidiphilus sp.]|jgi:hypothetical protein